MIDEVRTLIDQYTDWLRDSTTVRQIAGEWVEITTPYLDRNNDMIQIFAKRSGNGFLLSDGGNTIQELENSGCSLGTPKRQELLHLTLNGFGVRIKDDEIYAESPSIDFSRRKHCLIQAILAVSDLFYLASPLVSSLFMEDVESWLDSIGVRYSSRIHFLGKAGYSHSFDFVLPKYRNIPERLIQTINSPDRGSAEQLAFKWLDTKDARPSNSRLYALINDQQRSIPSGVVNALRSYDAIPVPWSEREGVRSELVA
jgi:hypothetical protein